MGKRQIRILFPLKKGDIEAWLGKELNIILKNQSTLHGKILSLQEDVCIFQDSRLNKRSMMISEIAEICLDHTSKW